VGKPPGAIRSRAQFDSILATTIDEVSRRERDEPAYPVWGLLRRHLERMRDTSSGGRTPRREDRDKCLPGTIAMRELEPAHDPEIYDLCQRLHELQYYFQEFLGSAWARFWR
jgi:hypothetical protein